MIFHIFCILNVFHLYEHSDVVQGYVHFWKIHHMCCKRLTFASYELSCDTSIGVLPQKFCYSADRKMVFPQNDTFCASQESLLVWMICCIVCMKITFFLCEPHCVFSEFGLFWNIFHRRGRQILTSVSYELSYDASIVLLPEKFCYSADKKNAFLQNDAFHASQECLLAWMICCNICM